jgi:L-ascorbate metabolism protein UlaG (beta-lactamase superfamily)
MDLGFETIGNATAIVYDKGPLLATDPWLVGAAYFGSWTHQHAIPAEQMEAVKGARFLWISHGHPDHLSLASLELLRDKEILLPDHYGARIYNELKSAGYRVWTLKDGHWIQLSERVRVLSLADVNQDAALLIDVDGTLVVNTNDAGDRGAGQLVRPMIPRFKDSYLLALMAYGDADMINLFDEDGQRIPPQAAKREPLGPGIAQALELYGIGNYIPFATLHRYQRTDSAWVNAHITEPGEFERGFASATKRCLPAYSRVDLAAGETSALDPAKVSGELFAPEEFGDNWSDELERADVELLRAYLAPIGHLATFLGYVNFRVGGKDNVIDVARDRFARGVTFETPRASLLEAVKWKVFDDLMIGNFTKTTLHGDWREKGAGGLYPDFNPFVAKYSDNGGANTPAELKAYFAEYHRRGFFSFGPRADDRRAREALGPYLPPGM